VRQPRHPTVRVRAQSTVGSLSSSGTRQSGATPDTHCSLSGAPLMSGSALPRTIAHCSSGIQLLQATVARSSYCSAGAPDSPVNYSGTRPEKPRVANLELYGPGAPDSLVRHTRAPLVPLLL
jgi:hypothetical protein